MTLRLMMIRIGLKRSVANRYAFGFYLFGNLISIAVMFFCGKVFCGIDQVPFCRNDHLFDFHATIDGCLSEN